MGRGGRLKSWNLYLGILALTLASCIGSQFTTLTQESASSSSFSPTMAALMGANGQPGNATNGVFWDEMGLRFSRIEIGPVDSNNFQELKDRGFVGTTFDSAILYNNSKGITTVVLLAYTSAWNSARAGDDKAAPKDVEVWKAYVEAAVKKYSAAPYSVKYFQVWNEAAGQLFGNSAQATFWHSAGNLNQSYADATKDYVDLIHIPAAKIIRSYGAYVVYGGWPDQGGIWEYTQWLDYYSTVHYGTMLDWTDYLDTHYLSTGDMEYFYKRYIGSGKIRGIWQTEVGFAYMENHNYIAQFYFSLAEMALRLGWTSQGQFAAMVFHWSGGQGFMLMNQSGGYHDSGISLKTLNSLVNGKLSPFANPIQLSAGASAKAVYSGSQIVFQILAPAGAATLAVDNLKAPAEGYTIAYKEAVFGTDLASAIQNSSWSGSHLSVQLNVPAGRVDSAGANQNLMGYLIITPK
jgi:hypothetical protein